MAGKWKKPFLFFMMSAFCSALAFLCASWGSFFPSAICLHAASFCVWRGFRSRSEILRTAEEVEWWKNAKNGVEQDPLDPCCVLYGKTSLEHEEDHCTRRRYPKPRIITAEELVEIDRAWNEIISHMDDPEYGEET